MALAGILLSIPLALDGETTTSNSTDIAILAALSMGLCYVGLAALWYFVFRDKSKAKTKREKDPSD